MPCHQHWLRWEQTPASLQVAILCNHQRSVPKGHANQMVKLTEKMEKMTGELEDLERELEAAKKGKTHTASKVQNPDRCGGIINRSEKGKFLAACPARWAKVPAVQADSESGMACMAAIGGKTPMASKVAIGVCHRCCQQLHTWQLCDGGRVVLPATVGSLCCVAYLQLLLLLSV